MASTAIKNARIFDGSNLRERTTIVIENGIITDKTDGDTTIDATGCTLLPGLIDCHVHLNDRVEHLELAGRNGVTTVLDMGARDPADIDRMKGLPGMPGVLAAYNIGCAPASTAPQRMGYPESAIIRDAGDAARFVGEQLAHGADYIKMILEEPGQNGGVAFPQDVGMAFVQAAHQSGKRVVAHAISLNTFQSGLDFGVDVLTHMSYTRPLTQNIVDAMAAGGTVCVPTLIMLKNSMETIKQRNPALTLSLTAVRQSVGALLRAGVPVFAGTDSNMDDATTLSAVPFGTAMHEELALLTASGMTPPQALRAATGSPARYFGLTDRGEIAPGKRADLLLVRGDPTDDIRAVGNVQSVWIGGVRIA